MANLLRGIWLCQNELIYKNIFKPPFTVIWEAEIEWESFHFAKESCTKYHTTKPRADIKWSLPLAHRVKTNWDASIDKEGKKWGTSIIIRDNVGQMIACLNSFYSSIPNPLVAECEALWRAMLLCEEIGCDSVDFEGDAKQVFDLILQVEECNT